MNTETPTIVSNIGSFEEFGNAVSFFDEAKTADDLAALIVDLSSDRPAQFSRREYTSRRSPRMFCEELANHITGGAHGPEDAAPNVRH